MYLPEETSGFDFSLLLALLTREKSSFNLSHKALSVYIRLQKTWVAVKFHQRINLQNTVHVM